MGELHPQWGHEAHYRNSQYHVEVAGLVAHDELHGGIRLRELRPEVGRGTDLVLLGQRLPEVGVALVAVRAVGYGGADGRVRHAPDIYLPACEQWSTWPCGVPSDGRQDLTTFLAIAVRDLGAEASDQGINHNGCTGRMLLEYVLVWEASTMCSSTG